MQMRRARAKSFLHHIRMEQSDIRWVVQITWNLRLNPQIHLRSALYFLTRRALCPLGLDHWLTLLEVSRSGNTSLAAPRNNHRLPVPDNTFFGDSCIRVLQYYKLLGRSCWKLGDMIYSRGKQRLILSNIHESIPCTDSFRTAVYRSERELS
jgi:hypothetical protein